MRKAIVLMLLAVLLVSSLPVAVSADYENTYQNTGDQRADIIGVALTQLGYQEGKGTGVWNNDTKYGDWAGWPMTEWCGWFVSWCARQAGVPTSVLRTNGTASPSGFGISNYYSSSEYTPRPGDLFFKKNFGHVGIVYYVDGDYFYTIEGNTSTSGWEGHSVMSRRRALSEFYFASPAYTSDSGGSTPTVHTHSYDTGWESSHPHREYKKCACGESYYTGNTRTVDTCSTCIKLNCTHTYGSWVDAGSSNHQKTCTGCGDKVTQSHSWQDGVITKEPTCKEKGAMEQKCSVCSRTRTQTLDKLEDHIYTDWIVGDDENHKRICEYCEQEQVQPHQLLVNTQDEPVWRSDNVNHWYECGDCGNKVQSEKHTLELQSDGATHWQVCTQCDKRLPQQTHVFDHGCDKDCNECGYTRQTVHMYDEQICKDETLHWYACVNCNQVKDQQAHVYQMSTWEDGSQVEGCSVCGQLSGVVIPPEETDVRLYYVAGGAAGLVLLVVLILTVRNARKRRSWVA